LIMNEFICCRNHKVDDKKLLGFELVQITTNKVKVIKERIKMA
jgi:hypothetical protein